MKIIALSGKMHSGKSYISDRLVSKFDYRHVSFAEPLKADIASLGFSREAIAQKPPWMRALMVAYGQARRAEDQRHWVKKVIKDLDASYLFSPDMNIVIDDMRFVNEALALVEFSVDAGVELRLVRLERLNYDRTGIPGANDDSERALDGYPFSGLCNFSVESGDLLCLDGIADTLAAACVIDG